MLMRRDHVNYLQWSACVSLISAILGTISLSTEGWVTASAKVDGSIEDVQESTINYGLFTGILIRRILASPKSYNIYLTCIFDANICIWSCQQFLGLRKQEAIFLLKGDKPPFSCPISTSTRSSNSFTSNSTQTEFLSASLAATSIFFVILTIIILYFSFILILINCFMSPAITFFNITGIYLLAILEFVINLLALIFYGSYYNNWIKNNIGILDTLVGDYKSEASLGYSYWIFFVMCLLHPVVAVFLKLRNNVLIDKRKETVIVVAKVNDPTTVLY
ncbi:uncharacterized protein LOC130663371 [Microplitis mediator]|uniref:uncharacterized protein LOC130663371 n=1 Tax=Microplitis mediator TaxID=375433 RepID=UPI0025565182|nr:uncharacterized protein LOC130663371 [Microplitis mediator]